MLTKTLNVTAEGLGKRSKEINSELRNLSKYQFQMEKELRKDKRTDKLTNLEKKTEVSLKKIAAKAKLEKEIAGLSEKAEQAALKKFNAILKANLTEMEMTAKTISMLHNVVKTEAEKVYEVKGSDYNALLKSIESKLSSIIDERAQTIGGKALTAESREAIANIKTNAERILGGVMPYKGKTGPIAARAYANDEINSLIVGGRPQGVPYNAKKGTYEGNTIWIIDKDTAYDATGKRIEIK